MLDITTPPLPSEPDPLPPQIREEDECPICHCELPPKGPNDSETAREAHIADCIDTHFSSSGPRTQMAPPPPPSRVAVEAAAAGQTGGSSSIVVAASETGTLASPPVRAGSSARRRTTGMVVYQATEKDCVGEDGGQQECVICFEEFEPGVGMGRLECLCKFHKVGDGCFLSSSTFSTFQSRIAAFPRRLMNSLLHLLRLSSCSPFLPLSSPPRSAGATPSWLHTNTSANGLD